MSLAQFTRREEQRFQRKVDTAKEQFEANEKRIAETTRRMIAEGRDADVYIDPATAYATMGQYEAEVFNDREAARFIAETPDFLPCAENLEAIGGYLGRNGMSAIVSAETLKAAYERLNKFGLLKRHADVQPESKPLDYASRPNVTVRIAPAKPAKPEPLIGHDLRTGERREFTQREVNLMSADEYRRTFRVYKSDLQLPNIGPGGHAQR